MHKKWKLPETTELYVDDTITCEPTRLEAHVLECSHADGKADEHPAQPSLKISDPATALTNES